MTSSSNSSPTPSASSDSPASSPKYKVGSYASFQGQLAKSIAYGLSVQSHKVSPSGKGRKSLARADAAKASAQSQTVKRRRRKADVAEMIEVYGNKRCMRCQKGDNHCFIFEDAVAQLPLWARTSTVDILGPEFVASCAGLPSSEFPITTPPPGKHRGQVPISAEYCDTDNPSNPPVASTSANTVRGEMQDTQRQYMTESSFDQFCRGIDSIMDPLRQFMASFDPGCVSSALSRKCPKFSKLQILVKGNHGTYFPSGLVMTPYLYYGLDAGQIQDAFQVRYLASVLNSQIFRSWLRVIMGPISHQD
ncbi:hypothetical protein BDN70DRAFT_902058 [Pholiota conissans]|uniref:Uncharacterized protein n=1 Tax=Pholiota conissans TaxID=109636 RepID=A0A9P6CQT3_9AGAR|nr:hypothetical protein BDN70DRAFT_902058 [Pholiota conissans]